MSKSPQWGAWLPGLDYQAARLVLETNRDTYRNKHSCRHSLCTCCAILVEHVVKIILYYLLLTRKRLWFGSDLISESHNLRESRVVESQQRKQFSNRVQQKNGFWPDPRVTLQPTAQHNMYEPSTEEYDRLAISCWNWSQVTTEWWGWKCAAQACAATGHLHSHYTNNIGLSYNLCCIVLLLHTCNKCPVSKIWVTSRSEWWQGSQFRISLSTDTAVAEGLGHRGASTLEVLCSDL